jgi:hypothetical protein
MPSSLDADAVSTAPTIEMAAVGRLSRFRLARRLRRLRRVA